jgi:2-oxo-4-hydroxy-4-carboxy--5-ureidoimidazoline (OHCU) decarboxylase
MSRGTEPRLVPLDELNRLAPNEFANAVRPLFEAAGPLLAGLAGARPFGSYAALIDSAAALAATLPEAAQVEVLNAHPRIGADPAQLSELAYREQGHGAGPPEDAWVAAELAALNAAYEARFGFRFVVFVNRRPRALIVDVLRGRLTNSRDQELATGLAEMFRIARDRLTTLDGSRVVSP